MIKKKVLLFGATGMAGHIAYYYLQSTERYELINVVYRTKLVKDSIVVDVTDKNAVTKLVEEVRPDLIINCIGVLIKGSKEHPDNAIFINAYFPHLLKKLSDKIQQTSKEKKIYLQNVIINLLYEKGIDTKKNKSLDLVLSTFDYYIGDLKNPLNLFLQGLNSIFFPLALACIQAGFQENTIANNSLLLVLMIFTIISSICIAFFSVFYAIENKNRFVAVEIRDYLLDYILKVDYKNSKKRIKNHWKHYE